MSEKGAMRLFLLHNIIFLVFSKDFCRNKRYNNIQVYYNSTYVFSVDSISMEYSLSPGGKNEKGYNNIFSNINIGNGVCCRYGADLQSLF